MLCLVCGHPMQTHRENYQYTASGLPHVTLQQVEVSRCPNCGETEVAIPHIEALHRAIANALVRKPTRLAPAEIRFLRKSLGWSGSDFAKRIGATPATVSRWEHGKTPMGPMAERLLRLLVVTEVPVQKYSTDLLGELDTASQTRAMPLGAQMQDDKWYADALAGV